MRSFRIRMTNQRYGLMKKSVTGHFRRLAAAAVGEARRALDHVDNVQVSLLREDGKEVRLRSYGPSLPVWEPRDYHTVLSWLAKDIASSCFALYDDIFQQTRSRKPYTYRRKNRLYHKNYGGDGVIEVDFRRRTIYYSYERLSAKRFSRTLLARYMAHYIDWHHDVFVREVTDREGLLKAIQTLEFDVRLGGGSLYLSPATHRALGSPKPEEVPLPF